MKLQGRNLSLQTPPLQGDDVKLLQSELQQLGFTIPSTEVASATFGQATNQAVVSFQAKHGLPTTGLVDAATAEKINAALNALQPPRFVVQGQVRRDDGKPVGPIIVRAFAVTSSGESPLGEATTDAADRYTIEYTATQFGRSPGQTGGPDLIVRAFDPSGAVLAASSVMRNADPVANIDLGIQQQVVPSTGSFVVRGQVRQADFSLFVGAVVQASDKDLRGEEPLGQAITDQEGRYEIRYTADQFRRAEKGSADLIVRVYANTVIRRPIDTLLPAGQQTTNPTTVTGAPTDTMPPAQRVPLVTSPVIFNAPPIATIDLVVGGATYPGPSEYEELVSALTPLLQTVPPVQPADLTDEDIAFLVGETELSSERITFFAVAARLAQQTAISQEAFYGLFRQALPTEVNRLAILDSKVLRRALDTAISTNIIPLRSTEWIANVIDRLREIAVAQTLATPADGQTIGGLVSVVTNDQNVQREFAAAYLAHQGRMPEFWSQLQQDSLLAPHISNLQRAFQFGALTRNHRPLVQALESRFQAGQHSSIARMLAPMTDTDWRSLIGSTGCPTDVPGNSTAEKTENYIKILNGIVETAFPTHYLSTRLNRTNIDHQEHVARFLDEHADRFNIRTDVLDKYLHDNPSALASAPPGTDDSLQTVQRLYKIAPHAEDMAAVAALPNIRSAHDVVRMGQDAFSSSIAETRGQDRAQTMYDNAAWASDATKVLFGQYAQGMNPVVGNSIGPPIPAEEQGQFPNFNTLFGSLDFCGCKECRSVYSPAAYLTELLSVLDTVQVGKSPMVLNFLFNVNADKKQYRRSDIGEILLNCENTNTPLPYIDLVNEIMEYVATGAPPPPKLLQTTRTAEELALTPEHVLSDAYDKTLTNAVYPSDLPFDLGLEMARTFLGPTGVSRAELMEKLQNRPSADPKDFSPTDSEIAGEYLRLSPADRAIITGKNANKPWDYWNLGNIANGYQIITPEGGIEVTNSWLEVLSYAREFIARSALSQEDFLELKDTHFVSRTLGGLTVDWPVDKCSLDWARIRGLEANRAAERIYRFMRLQRKLGWTIRDLDRFASVFSTGDFDDTVLLKLSYLQRIRERLNLSLAELLAWWGNIDTSIGPDEQTSFYDRIFPRTADPADDSLALNANRDQLAKPDKLPSHLAEVAAGLRITVSDLASLIDQEPPDDLDLTNLSRVYRIVSLCRATGLSISDYLSLKKLNLINPFDSTVASAWQHLETLGTIRDSGFSIAELDYLLRHVFKGPSGIAPDSEEVAIVLEQLREGLRRIAQEVGYPMLGLGSFPPPDPKGDLIRKSLAVVLPSDTAAQVLGVLIGLENSPNVTAVHSGFAASDPVNIQGPFTNPDVPRYLAVSFGAGWDAGDISISGTDANNAVQSETFAAAPGKVVIGAKGFQVVSAVTKAQVTNSTAMASVGTMSKSVAEVNTFVSIGNDLINNLFGVLVTDPAKLAAAQSDARNNLVDDGAVLSPRPHPALVEPVDRFSYVLAPLLQYLSRARSESLIKKQISESLSLEIKSAGLLLNLTDPISNVRYLDRFFDPGVISTNGEANDQNPVFAPWFASYSLLHKAALVIRKFRITSEELAALITTPSTFGGLQLNEFPVHPVNVNFGLFHRWLTLAGLFALRNRLPIVKPSLFSVMERTSQQPVPMTIADLADLTGWDETEIAFVANTLGLTTPLDFGEERKVHRLKDAFDLLKRLGLPSAKVAEWIKPQLTYAAALEIKNAVKSRYESQEWQMVAKPLQDSLREKQRSALVSLITGRDGISADQLFDKYLIDAETSACQLTSRIKQAISAVQLFYQRITMGLESWTDVNGNRRPLALGARANSWWNQWMKSYRVWEANRKIFLYPENWIEPELRDDKSPFFRDLEKSLTHGDVTPELVEDAYLKYLEQLDDVALLDVRAIYHQNEPATQTSPAADVLHVFGRTRGTPHVYYYRTMVGLRSWTPWEKLDVDITGDHLIPVVYQRRLHLFWPLMTVKSEDSPRIGGTNEQGTPPRKYLEIQLAWSEYRNGKWTAKRVTKEAIATKRFEENNYTKNERFMNQQARQNNQPEPFTQEDILAAGTVYEFCNPENVIFNAVAAKDLKGLLGTAFQGDPDDLWIVCRVVGGMKASVVQNTTKRTGWFIISGCGGTTLTRDITDDAFPFNVKLLPATHYDAMQLVEDDQTDPKIDNTLTLIGSDAAQQQVVLQQTPGRFRLAHNHNQLNSSPTANDFAVPPLFYMDNRQAYAIVSASDGTMTPDAWAEANNADPGMLIVGDEYDQYSDPNQGNGKIDFRFLNFYHPYTCDFIRRLNSDGIDGPLGLLTVQTQQLGQELAEGQPFDDYYQPQGQWVVTPYPRKDVDFSSLGAYSQYNWELFFHAPLLIAGRLSKNQQFEEARRWFHYIFDPTDPIDGSDLQAVWKFQPFKNRHLLLLQELMALLDYKGNEPTLQLAAEVMYDDMIAWRNNPFDPHLIARHRLGAYMQNVVMKYIDNLIAWGDQLFRQDTLETINEATLLYILASEVLGPRPQEFPDRRKIADQTYNDIRWVLDSFSNALVRLENWVPPKQQAAPPRVPLPPGMSFYFCIPPNDKLLGYWDVVADRLFKIRHCLNIEGIFQQLPLFEPPIDPGLLVRAKAAGVDISSALLDTNTALPQYRFSFMTQKALDFCADVRSLGAALLSALEKKEAEALGLLRSEHEVSLLAAVREVRQRQIDETEATLEGLNRSLELIQARFEFYKSREFINIWEAVHLKLIGDSALFQDIASAHEAAAALAHWLPNFKFGPAGWASSPTFLTDFGGVQVGGSLQAMAANLKSIASQLSTAASLSATMGGYQRRQDDWNLQRDLASKELEQVKQQILGAEIRLELAQKELENHDLQIQNAKEVDSYLRDKFTGEDLYDWMVTQLAGVYFQSYQLAYDLAKRAERAFQFERCDPQASFIKFGYWDSLKKGLLAGEGLHYDLRRMEAAYLDQNKREYEMTKHISLVLLNPLALIALKETGQCIVDLPEALFDMDYPGHYMRRIRNVTLTIPCVTGPYTSINCTLTLLKSSIREKSDKAGSEGNYRRDVKSDDQRFVSNFGATQSIATSHAQNDSGMFELNFRDERYLPFEGSGVISQWRIEMPRENNAFDFETISDVIFNLNYTSWDGGDVLKAAVQKEVVTTSPISSLRMFSLKHEFSNEWYRFLNPVSNADKQTLQFDLTQERFPFQFRGRRIEISQVELFLKFKEINDSSKYQNGTPLDDYAAGAPLTLYLTRPKAGKALDQPLESDALFMGGLPHTQKLFDFTGQKIGLGSWSLEAHAGEADGDIGKIAATLQDDPVKVNDSFVHHLKAEVIEDIYMICHYSAS